MNVGFSVPLRDTHRSQRTHLNYQFGDRSFAANSPLFGARAIPHIPVQLCPPSGPSRIISLGAPTLLKKLVIPHPHLGLPPPHLGLPPPEAFTRLSDTCRDKWVSKLTVHHIQLVFGSLARHSASEDRTSAPLAGIQEKVQVTTQGYQRSGLLGPIRSFRYDR